MNIGISTVYDADNFGAFMQAYALKTVLEKYGHKVFHIRYRSNRERKHSYFNYDNISFLTYIKRHLGFSYKKYKIYKKAIKVFNEIEYEQAEKMDVVIVGSDEIWNVTNENIVKVLNVSFCKNKNKIGYAVSCGNSTYEEMMEKTDLVKEIRRMKKIFGRDENTCHNVSKISGKKVERVCDPTLLMDIKDYPKPEVKRDKKYIVFYGYYSDEKTVETLKEYAASQDLNIISIGNKNYWCESIPCNPFECISYLQNAEFIVTATFHGSIFSILLNKKVIFIDYGSEKMNDLLNYLGMEDKIVRRELDKESLIRLLNDNYDYDNINKKITEFRNSSLKKLKDTLHEV